MYDFNYKATVDKSKEYSKIVKENNLLRKIKNFFLWITFLIFLFIMGDITLESYQN